MWAVALRGVRKRLVRGSRFVIDAVARVDLMRIGAAARTRSALRRARARPHTASGVQPDLMKGI
jgi:hypothetical protein